MEAVETHSPEWCADLANKIGEDPANVNIILAAIHSAVEMSEMELAKLEGRYPVPPKTKAIVGAAAVCLANEGVLLASALAGNKYLIGGSAVGFASSFLRGTRYFCAQIRYQRVEDQQAKLYNINEFYEYAYNRALELGYIEPREEDEEA